MALAMPSPVSCAPTPSVSSVSTGAPQGVSSAPPAAAAAACVIQKEVREIVNNMLSVAIPAAAAAAAAAAAVSSADPRATSASISPEMVELCRKILVDNDQGGYTVPTKGLYPYQWNWDSALVSLGLAQLNEARAWEELEHLMNAQWNDGMVPHIIFHKPSPTYFPGPEIWGSPEHPRSSTGITQPPVAAISVRRLVEQAKDVNQARIRAGSLFPKLLAWHRWFYSARDPENSGLVATLHPWETGMDNSPAWDEALARVPVDPIPPYVRRDLGHVDAKMRPQKAEYDRYITLVYRFRAVDYDLHKLYFQSPFRVTDLCTNCVLHRANEDLLWLAGFIGDATTTTGEDFESVKEEIGGWIRGSRAAFDSLYDEEAGLYKSRDQLSGELVGAETSAGFLPLFAGVASGEQAEAVVATLVRWLAEVEYGVPSCGPQSDKFEELRYWRGPVWLVVNWMIVDGLRRYGFHDVAARIERDSLRLILKAGIFEYFSPLTGAGAGGGFFSWTAAMCLAWLCKTTTAAATKTN